MYHEGILITMLGNLRRAVGKADKERPLCNADRSAQVRMNFVAIGSKNDPAFSRPANPGTA
jgi:hypothetical protein